MTEQADKRLTVTRRSFLKIGGMSAAFLFAGGSLSRLAARADASGTKRLVILELNGGNDGLNMVIPYGDGGYYDARQQLAIPANRVLPLDSNWGLHYSLGKLQARYGTGQVAVLRGVGYSDPDLSHFRMMDIWRSGNPGGAQFTEGTGWVGRLLGFLPGSSALIAAMTLSSGLSPMLLGPTDKAAAAESPDTGALPFPNGIDPQAFRNAMMTMAIQDGSHTPLNAARDGITGGLELSDFLTGLPAPDPSYPSTYSGQLLSFAAQLLKANDWIRIAHVPLPLDLDTHVNQMPRQEANYVEMDPALDAFLNDLDNAGLFDQTLVLTTSEFGRRVEPNGDDGTDHGTASFHFVIGKSVNGGLYGDPPSLTNLDDNGNLISTLSFLDLEATAINWLGVDPSAVLPGGTPIKVF